MWNEVRHIYRLHGRLSLVLVDLEADVTLLILGDLLGYVLLLYYNSYLFKKKFFHFCVHTDINTISN